MAHCPVTGLAFDTEGRLLAITADGTLSEVGMPEPANTETARRKNGSLMPFSTPGGAPQGLVVSAHGEILVLDAARQAIVHADPSVQEDGGAPEPGIIVADYEGRPLRGPHSAVFDSFGNLYFSDPGPYGDTGLGKKYGSVFVVTSGGDRKNGGGGNEVRLLHPVALECLAGPTGVAVSPGEGEVYVCERAENRIVRFHQKPAGVFHGVVFHRFSGRSGPSAIVCDHERGGLLYVARPDAPDCSEHGIVTVLSPDGAALRDLTVPGPEVTCLALSPDGMYLYGAESTTNTVFRLVL